MKRARRVSRFGMLLVAAIGCARSTQMANVGEPPSPPPASCERADTLIVAVTPEVDAATVRAHLEQAPLGACAILAERRIVIEDARDALDVGVAMLITSQPAALAYAERRSDVVSTALAWDRTYAMVVSDSIEAFVTKEGFDSLRAELARDVVRADARPSAEPPCGLRPTPRARIPRVGYPRDDAVGRSIAARLVAVALPGDSLRVDAGDHAPPRAGDAISVISWRTGDAPPCDVGWVVPLIETRARAIRRLERP